MQRQMMEKLSKAQRLEKEKATAESESSFAEEGEEEEKEILTEPQLSRIRSAATNFILLLEGHH